jgi:hypothetical protein
MKYTGFIIIFAGIVRCLFNKYSNEGLFMMLCGIAVLIIVIIDKLEEE